MNNLKIDLSVILDCIVNKIAVTYIKEDILIIKDLEKSITKQHKYMQRKEVWVTITAFNEKFVENLNKCNF